MYIIKKMIKKLLLICCYFDYHPKIRLIDVKIGFGLSGKIEKVECIVCKKIFIHKNNKINLKIVFIIILLFFLLLLLL